MRIPLEWLKEFVDFRLSPKELAMKLTMAGFEVESVEEKDNDAVFEVNVTPNRPDCLSILGIAREVAALLNLPLKLPEYEIKGDDEECGVSVEITDEDLCHRYAGRAIKGVKIADAPEWMKKRIEKCGMRPVNNIVDVTNYVLLEFGHPLHAFDMDEIGGKKIRVARAHKCGKVATLDSAEREVPEDSLLIWDSSRPVAVAGVMGGANSEVSGKTKDVFLESAYFLPSSVRRTSKALGLKTESAYRFERGTDIEFLEKALDRAAFLIAGLAGGKVSKKADAYPKKFKAAEIRIRPERVNKIIGIQLSAEEIAGILKRLNISVKEGSVAMAVLPPSYRGDIQREIDIIEEVARFYGYDKIPVTNPKTPITKESPGKHYSYISAVKDTFRKSGFSEVINYSFINPDTFDQFHISNEDIRRNTIRLLNPINAEEPALRTLLVPSLINNLVYNVSQGNRDVRLFETSRVFLQKDGTLPGERQYLGAIYFKEKTPSLWKDETPDFYVVKGTIEAMMEELKIRDLRYQDTSQPFLHPGKSCDIFVSGVNIGFMGVLHPDITEKLDLKASRPEIVIVEMDIDRLLPFAPETMTYSHIPRFPFIDRDIAIIVNESVKAALIIDEIQSYHELIEDVSVFDYYKGKNIPQGMKNLAFSVRYRAKDRTLTDAEIEEIQSRLVNHIVAKTGGTVRGI